MGVASREDKFATSIERSTIQGVEDTAGHTTKEMTCIGECETDVGQTIMRAASRMTLSLCISLHGTP